MNPGTARRRRAPPTHPQHGLALIEGLVAMVILSIGLLGLARFQTGLIAQSTEAQSRQQASALADELLSTVLVDSLNAGCYTLPQSGECTSDAALARATEWRTRAEAALPGSGTATSTLDAGNRRFTVRLGWTGKASQDTHQLEMSTDAR